MKLRNKKTGNAEDLLTIAVYAGYSGENLHTLHEYHSLADLNDEWEDYEEPKIKKYFWISPLDCGVVEDDLKWNETELDDEIDIFNVSIGNYFETKEEAEKAVEKLKAWKRLKDKGFEITSWENSIGDDYYKTGQIVLNLNNTINREWDEYDNINDIKADLDLLFGAEE